MGMPIIGIAKRRLADKLGSAATRGEGRRTCSAPTLQAQFSPALQAQFSPACSATRSSIWWLDPIAALMIAAVAVKEGRESWRGEGCCAGC
jgi:hypothetical protein